MSKKRKVLIVEDDINDQNYLKFFEDEFRQCEFFYFQTAESAWEWLEKEPRAPSLITTDIKLPAMSGKQLTQKIRKVDRYRHVPVIAMSGHDDDSMIRQMLEAGVCAYHIKPNFKSEQRELVHTILDYWLNHHAGLI